MFVIFVFILTTVFAQNHEKYIDYLSEEDKQQFLDKVARRIMDAVDSVEDGKLSRELTDDQLHGHSKFVKDILKEEVQRYKTRKSNSDDERNTEETELNVQPLVSQKKGKVDTASNNIRIDENQTLQNYSTDNINVGIVTEYLPMQQRSLRTDGKGNKIGVIDQVYDKTDKEEELSSNKTKKSRTESQDVMTKDFTSFVSDKPIINITLLTKRNEDNSVLQKVNVKIDDKSNTLPIEDNRNLSNIPRTIKSIDDKKTGTLTTLTKAEKEELHDFNLTTIPPVPIFEKANAILTTTDKPMDNDEPLKLRLKNIINNLKYNENKSNLNKTSSVIDNKSAIRSTDEEITDINTGNDKNNQIKDTVKVESHTNEETKKDVKTLNTPLIKELIASSTLKPSTIDTIANNNRVSEKGLKQIESIENSVKTTTPYLIPLFIPIESKKSFNKINKLSLNRILKQSEDFNGNPYLKPKSKYLLGNKKSPLNLKSYMKGNYDETYHVYEMPWANLRSMKSSEPEVEDSPLFIPVYNYSPDNAFYNPNNRLGPNAGEENTIELDTLRGGKTGKGNQQEFVIDLKPPLRFGAYIKQYKTYVPVTTTTTALDDNKENESGIIELPDSHEELHPYNSMKNGMKTHIKAVRDVLNKNQAYGEQEPVQRDEYIQYLYGNKDILEKYGMNNETTTESTHEDKAIRLKRSDKKRKKRMRQLRSNDFQNRIYLDYFGRMNKPDRNKLKEGDRIIFKNKNKIDKSKRYKIVLKTPLSRNGLGFSMMPGKEIFHDIKPNELESKKVATYIKVLKTLVEDDNKAMKQYDWLTTIVQVQSALAKLLHIIGRVKQSLRINPSDVQILKCMMFFHKFAVEVQNWDTNSLLRIPLPRQHERMPSQLKGFLRKMRLAARSSLHDLKHDEELTDFEEFLIDVHKYLFDLHEAVASIATVTKFKKQNWFVNLRQLYLTTNRKHLLELLLHITFAKLVQIIELNYENGLDLDFIEYLKDNKHESERALKEMVFVLEILDEIKDNLE